jgi:hypothetical protein
MIKFRGTKLAEELQRRIGKVAGRRPAARIVVPEELAWWYFQEFGSTGPYEIVARDGGVLRLPPTADYPHPTFRSSVMHPGVAPKAYVREVLPDIQQMAAKEMTAAFVQSDYDPQAVQDVLMSRVMPDALDRICESMSKELHQTRTAEYPGKLGTAAPEDVFRSSAEIKDTGE